jgi:hypothetical protein
MILSKYRHFQNLMMLLDLRDLYLNFSIEKSTINMVRDVIASGDEISGTVFAKDYYTSSYSNGNLIRA